MVADITREEFEARVGVLEREVEGEKMVTRHILEQIRRNSDDLAAIKTRLDRVERKVDGLDVRIDGVEASLGARIDGVATKVDELIRSLPKMLGDAVRDALSGRRD